MKVLLHKEIFDKPELQADISYLIQTLVRKGHRVLLSPDVTELPDWLSPADRDILDEFNSGAIIGNVETPDCKVTLNGHRIDRDKEFSVSEALKYVDSPLVVLIENGTNDSPLVEAGINHYTPAKSIARGAFVEQRLDYGNAGGCGGVKNFITGQLQKRHANRPKFLRFFVILDGDRRYPGHNVTKYDSLKIFLDSVGVGYHILEKRCMENYLPTDSYPSQERNATWLAAFRNLSPQQRDCFNISGGFRGELGKSYREGVDIRSQLPAELQTFYADVSDANFRILSAGYDLPSFKSEFPKGFDDYRTNRATLDAVQAHQADSAELRGIALQIEKLL